ncbi:hypothetical protein ACH9D2_13830 [Kocuria sp. M4R2S49]|uniref:hypothetical protein n=1 Tax=Kocuria rhizosphaericola TaxID=3376284 RepID=UPI0037A68F8B
MADLFDFNHGGATHPGARAAVHPGADFGEHVVLYTVVAETDEHIVLDDGFTYDKRTGVVLGPSGRPTLQNRMTATEGSAMFASWSGIARLPHRPVPDGAPGGGSAPPGAPQRRIRTLLRRLGRR